LTDWFAEIRDVPTCWVNPIMPSTLPVPLFLLIRQCAVILSTLATPTITV